MSNTKTNAMRNPPADSLSEGFTTCSEWCHAMWSQSLDRGDQKAADEYIQMYNLWKERGQ